MHDARKMCICDISLVHSSPEKLVHELLHLYLFRCNGFWTSGNWSPRLWQDNLLQWNV